MGKKLAVPRHLYVAPLTYGLVHGASSFELLYDIPAANALHLRNKDVDSAFLTPIDYARESSDYIILPGIAVSSREESGTIALFFRSGLSSISTVAVDIGLTSEILLSRIVLSEKYDINPQFIPMEPDRNAMLQKADAALLAGNYLLDKQDQPDRLDLVDEWTDLTELPYVHGFWGYRPDALDTAERTRLRMAGAGCIRDMDLICAETDNPALSGEYLRRFSYVFDEGAVESLGEFFRYAFYYGAIKDVPEIRFDSPDE